jgi:hypothetical protein
MFRAQLGLSLLFIPARGNRRKNGDPDMGRDAIAFYWSNSVASESSASGLTR